MRVLFSITYYTPYISGLTIYVRRLAKELVKHHYDVSIMTSRHRNHLPLDEMVDGVRMRRVPVALRLGKGAIMPLWIFFAYQEVKKSDVVIINLPQFEGVVPALFGRLLGKKVIVIYHCEVVLPSGIVNKLIEKFLWALNMMSIKLAHNVVTYTEDYAKNAKLLTNLSSKISYVYPPIPAPVVDKVTRQKFGKIIAKKEGEMIVGFAGRVSAEKGLEYLLEAINVLNSIRQLADKTQNLRTFKLVIAGPREEVVGERAYLKNIDNLTKELGDQVVFLGSVPERGMGAFYSLIDLLVLPSINSTEAFGMVQVEAMLVGVPIVASDLPGVRVPIEKTGMGKIVPIKDSQRLAEAIIAVISHPERFMKSRVDIKKEFSLEKTVEFYEDLFL